jgi:hypothetical protein
LERSLWLLTHQRGFDGSLEIWLLDDGSDEHLEDIPGVNYLLLREPGAAPRSSNRAYRAGYEACPDADFVILSHPEYMVPRESVQRCLEVYEAHDRLQRVGHSPIAIPKRIQDRIDIFDWGENLMTFVTLPGIWAERSPWGWLNADAMGWCHHFAFSGQSRAGWNRFGFLPDTEQRGQNDSWLLPLESVAGQPPVCSGLLAFHQWHERIEGGLPPKRSVRVERMVG